jgi:hypothetical protein
VDKVGDLVSDRFGHEDKVDMVGDKVKGLVSDQD